MTGQAPGRTIHQAEIYGCRYCHKYPKNMGAGSVLFDVLEDMEQNDEFNMERDGEIHDDNRLGGKLHRVFMAEIGEEMCEAEVAHYAMQNP